MLDPLLIKGGIMIGESLISYATEKGLDWSSGKAWNVITDRRHHSPVCGDLYNVVEKCVLNAITYKGNVKKLLDFESVTSACEIVYESMVKSGRVDDTDFLKIKTRLQNDSIYIGSQQSLNDSLVTEICTNTRNDNLYKYLLFLGILNIGENNSAKEKMLSEKQFLEMMEYMRSNNVSDIVNSILKRLLDKSNKTGNLYLKTKGAIADETERTKFVNYIVAFEEDLLEIEEDFLKSRSKIPVKISEILDDYFSRFKEYINCARYLVINRENQDIKYRERFLHFSEMLVSLSIEKHNEVADSISIILNS